MQEDEHFEGFPEPAAEKPRPGPRNALYVRSTAEVSAADRATQVNIILKRLAGDSLEAAGLVSTRVDRAAVLSSGGVSDAYRATTAAIRVLAIEDSGASGYAGGVHRDLDRLDPASVASTAARKSVRGRDAIALQPGPYDVILEPSAVSEVLEWMAMGSFGARSLEDHSSFLAGRIGDSVTGDGVTIRSLGADAPEGAPSEAFDVEGTPREVVTLVDGGKAAGVVHDHRTARRASTGEAPVRSTGHATFGAWGSGPAVKHLEMEAGTDTFGGLVSKVERGLWVTRFHYVNGLLEPRVARMTGMTRDGTFLIENGRVTRGVANLRFSDSFLEAFGRIEGITADRRAVPTWWADGGAHVVPGVLIRQLHFSG
jgi:PmbA protein